MSPSSRSLNIVVCTPLAVSVCWPKDLGWCGAGAWVGATAVPVLFLTVLLSVMPMPPALEARCGKPLFSMMDVKKDAEAFGVRGLSGSEKLT